MNSQNHRGAFVKKSYESVSPTIPLWKRSIDLTCCLIALPFLCIIALVMAVYLRLVSRGPILFKQERIGYKGSPFMCYKFRTMRVGADTKSHQAYCDSLIVSRAGAPMVKLDAKGDARVIPGGWVLRATGLDELPQIINIYKREMSVVGPRPCIQYEYDRYEPSQRQRCDAVPGLTGLWQVSGKNRTTFDQMIDLDIEYSKTSSFWLDVRIILGTVPALLVQVADTLSAKISRAQTGRTPKKAAPSGSAVKRRPQPVNS